MKNIIERIAGGAKIARYLPKAVSTRLLVLALGLGLVSTGWAANAPTATVSGTSVTISNESGAESWDNASIDNMTNYQGKDFTIPAIGTDLPSGTILKITSVSVAKSKSRTYMPDKLGLSGCISAYRTITTGGFTSATADKYTYSFADTDCLVKVGTATPIRFYQNSGAEHNGEIAFRLGYNAYQFIASIVWSSKVPIIEIQAEIVSGFVNSTSDSSQSDWGFESGSGSGKVYLSGYGNYLKTPGSNEKEIVLVDGTYGYGLKVINGNSTTAGGNVNGTVFTKLSGTGTLTTDYNGNSGVKSVVQIYDSSDFTGAIQTGFSAGPKASVVFRNSGETLPGTLYNLVVATTPAQIYVSAGKTGANAITIPAGKTWRASCLSNCGETIINGTFSGPIVNSGTLTINGTVTGSIANSGSGTVTVNAGAALASLGSVRDFTGFSVDSSVPVMITMTAEEYGKGSLSISGASGISSITVLAPDGTTTVDTITPTEGAGTLETGVKVDGKACWFAYEMEFVSGNTSKTGFENSGVSAAALKPDSYNNVRIQGADAFDQTSGTLYTYAHPFVEGADISFPSKWTAMVRCTVPRLENAIVVMFGTYWKSAIGLVAGEDPESEMKLVSIPGYNDLTAAQKENADCMNFTTLKTISVTDAATDMHTYVFTLDGTTVNLYCDGRNVLADFNLGSVALGNGFQVGSLHGGVEATSGRPTNLVRFGKDESQMIGLSTTDQKAARVDSIRLYDYILSADQVDSLKDEFPPVTGYRATISTAGTYSWASGAADSISWNATWDNSLENKAITLTVEDDATVTLPTAITADTIRLNVAAGKTLTLSGTSTLRIDGTGNVLEINGGTLKLAGTVTLDSDVALNGSVVFDSFTANGTGVLKLAAGATVGVTSGSVTVTTLGAYTRTDGTVVDSVHTGDGVKLIPLASAVVSITQSGTTLYYSDLDTALGPLVNAPGSISEDVQVTLLNDTTLPFGYDSYLLTAGYYINGNVITKAVARIGSTTYPTLAAAVGSAADRATVVLLRASSETITLNKAITLSETANFSGTLTGNGTLTFATFRNNPSITFDNWTGTVVLPSFAADGTKLNNYGVAGSTVVLKGITGGWFGETSSHKMDVNPVLQLDGNVTIKGFSTSWDYTFAELAGTGNFVLDPTDNSPKSVTITKVAKGFTGIITNNTDKTLTIATLDREAGTQVTGGMKLLTTGGSGDITASSLTVGGVAQGVTLRTESDGIYVVAASVHKGDNTPTIHTTVAAAMTEAGSDAATITLLANTSSDIALAVGQSLVTDGFSVGTVSTGATYYHVVNNAGVYTVVLDTYTITIPSVANTTVSVSYTSGGEALFATAAGDITVDAGTDVTANWTAASGYKITSGASQTLNAVTSAQALTPPTVEAMGATVSDVNFNYGADYATAIVTATVSGDATSATLSYGNTTYDANVVNGTVTFENVAVTRGSDIYAPAGYTITAKDGETDVTTTGGSGTTVAANVVAANWINENATTHGQQAAGGSWTNAEAVTYSEGKAAITDNRFEATTASTASRVILEFNVCFSSVSDANVDGTAQAAIKIGEVESAATFMVLAQGGSWTPVSNADLTPDPAATYKVVLTIDYGAGSYGVTVGDNALTNATGSASFPLAANKTSVQTIDFAGSGTLTSMKGDQIEGYMVKDNVGHWYATIQEATQAYSSANGPYTVLHSGTAPSGWKIDGNTLIKLAKGFFFMAY